jgi:hypothetical protein
MKNENRQFDAQEQKMEALLSEALLNNIEQTPEGLADRVMAASTPMLAGDKELEDLISVATQSGVPAGLTDRIMTASAPLLSQTSELDDLLVEATKVEIPTGLADRVMRASLVDLRSKSPVIGHIGFAVKMQRLALAACVVFAVLIAIRMDVHSTPDATMQVVVQESQLLSPEEEGYLLDDLNLGEYAYLADARNLSFTELSSELNGLHQDLELWQYGLLTE